MHLLSARSTNINLSCHPPSLQVPHQSTKSVLKSQRCCPSYLCRTEFWSSHFTSGRSTLVEGTRNNQILLMCAFEPGVPLPLRYCKVKHMNFESLELASSMEGRRHLRSTDAMDLLNPVTRCRTLGDRSFPVGAWNTLSSSVQLSSSPHVFRRCLKRSRLNGFVSHALLKFHFCLELFCEVPQQ